MGSIGSAGSATGQRPAYLDEHKDKIILYFLALSGGRTPTNQLKPLVVCEALSIPYHVHVVHKERDDAWLQKINPYALLPAVEDTDTYTIPSGDTKRICLFDSAACMLYLTDKFDKEGLFRGRDAAEKASVLCWLVSHSSGLSATGEWWLRLHRPEGLHAGAIERLIASVEKEYDVLERRLGEPGQKYIALADRPTIADFAFQLSANEMVTGMAGIDFSRWPRLREWSAGISKLPYWRRATFLNNVSWFSEEDKAALTPARIEELSCRPY